MSEMQVMMKFEFLPNEILMECYKYLNAPDIFDSFDQLNYRFYKLIRNIPLHVDFQYVSKSSFDNFCRKIILNPENLKQIYSLHLSNKEMYGQIEAFLSIFTFNEFSNLQSLILTQVKEINMNKLKSMLILIPKLYSLRLIDCNIPNSEIMAVLTISKLRILSIRSLYFVPLAKNETSVITNLTVFGCLLSDLYRLFQYAPLLKYLNVGRLPDCHEVIGRGEDFINNYAFHLRQLIIDEYGYEFEDFEIFVKQIPNLKSLIISAYDNIDIIDASRWEHLIKSSLPHLHIFKFKFYYSQYGKSIIADKFNQFQSDFWLKQHHWYTEYSLKESLGRTTALIYTLPCIADRFELKLDINRYYNKLINNFDVFHNIKYLSLDSEILSKECHYYFSNVTSLILKCKSNLFKRDSDRILLKAKHIKSLKMIVNLYNLKHLDISFLCKIESSTILLEILKQSPNLSSISVDPNYLLSLFSDNELCKYLNKMIKKLDMLIPSLDKFSKIEQFCKIFSNIEQLKCNITQLDDLLFLLNNLSKLSILKVSDTSTNKFIYKFKDEASKLNIVYYLRSYHDNSYDKICNLDLSIWIGKKTN
ncbi:unnamed protein product [Rotaria sordida]|uniref:F-box domain-containing protein n=1 Tax=Rotaria sordida TaxID=392033 RepID=A0A814WIA7_9BILA|nr:unnamed protein product [Rotaria sordida]CAF1474479.1 unnamed protein product [Rotaria sordida]